MSEILVNFTNQNNKLYGILHQPDFMGYKEVKKKYAVLFLHGWVGYRAGPHRLFVDLARKLCDDGFICLRFDFAGRGYSEGDREITNLDTAVLDTQCAIDFIRKTI